MPHDVMPEGHPHAGDPCRHPDCTAIRSGCTRPAGHQSNAEAMECPAHGKPAHNHTDNDPNPPPCPRCELGGADR